MRYRNLAKDWLSGNAQTRLHPRSLLHSTRQYCISALNTPRLKLHKNYAAGTFTLWTQSRNKCERFFKIKITLHNWNIPTFVRHIKPFSWQTAVKTGTRLPWRKIWRQRTPILNNIWSIQADVFNTDFESCSLCTCITLLLCSCRKTQTGDTSQHAAMLECSHTNQQLLKPKIAWRGFTRGQFGKIFSFFFH